MRTAAVFAVIACFLSTLFGETTLENSQYFSPDECYSPDAKIAFFTRDYFEFAKLYNAPTREAAAENFRRLYENAKTDCAKAWAVFGLVQLGEPSPDKAVKARFFDGGIGNAKVNPNGYAIRGGFAVPEKFAEINIADFDPPPPEKFDDLAKSILHKSRLYNDGVIFAHGEPTAEAWALDRLTRGRSSEEIRRTSEEIWQNAEHFVGKLYALLLLKKSGDERAFKNRLDSLDKSAPFAFVSGCFIEKQTMLTDKPTARLFGESFFKKSPPPFRMNPRDENLNLIPMCEIGIKLRESQISEDKLGYIPMRFQARNNRYIAGEGLQRLAEEWDKAEPQSRRDALQNLLKFANPSAPKSYLALYDNNRVIKVENINGRYVFVKYNNPKLGDEPCFDPVFYTSTDIRKLERRVFLALAKQKLAAKPSAKISLYHIFDYANSVAADYAKCGARGGRYVGGLAEKLARRISDGEKFQTALVLTRFGENGAPSLWLCPIFSDISPEQLEALKEQHKSNLESLDADGRRRYAEIAKKHKSIFDIQLPHAE